MSALRPRQAQCEGMEDDTPNKWQTKESRCCHILLRKADFKIKMAMRDKEGQYIMIKSTLHQEDITLINVYAPKIGAPEYIK